MALKTSEVPALALRRESGDLLGRVQYHHERMIITKNGRPAVAMVPLEDLALIESALGMTSKKAKTNDQGVATFNEAMSEAVSANPRHIGESFDNFLKEEGIYKQVKATTAKRVKDFLKQMTNEK
jgi:prevent-host-death family protein